MKEEERIERIIRGLLKQPDNRRCINCNSLGPQYVCTTFWTFICTNCSGIHREFTHRVKSVSMAKFTADEVSSLQAGGNERARQTFFKTWDPSRNFCPDGSNLNKLREFIRTVYVDRRFTGDRIQDNRPSTVKLGSKDVYDDRRSFERSTPTAREAFVERHSFECSSLADRRSYEKFGRGGREDLHDRWSVEKYTSPRKNDERGLRYCIDQIRSPVRQKSRSARFEIVDDRFREDRPGNVKKYEHYRFSRTESKRTSRSPDARRVRSEQSPPVVSPVKAILGEKAPELKVGEPPTPKPKATKETNGSAKAEKTGVSKNSSGSSANAKASRNEVVQPVSLIDFDTDPQSPAVTSTTQPIASSPETSGTTSSNDKVSPVDSLEALLFGLSPSVATTENKSLVPFINDANPGNGITPPARDAAETEILALPGPEDFEAKVQNVQQLHSMQAFPSRINSLTPQQSATLAFYNQHSTSEPSPNFGERAAFSNTPQQSSQPASTPARDASSGNDLRSSGRRELPAELFTSSYAPFAAASSVWQFHPPHGMGYGMQYNPHPRMMVSTKSRNPFDYSDESPQVPAPMFPSMIPLQGPSPNMSPSPPFPYSLASPQLASSYGMAMPAGAYVGQQLNDNMLIPRHQRSHSAGTGESAFASLKPVHQSSSGITYQVPSASNPPLSRGNPFS